MNGIAGAAAPLDTFAVLTGAGMRIERERSLRGSLGKWSESVPKVIYPSGSGEMPGRRHCRVTRLMGCHPFSMRVYTGISPVIAEYYAKLRIDSLTFDTYLGDALGLNRSPNG